MLLQLKIGFDQVVRAAPDIRAGPPPPFVWPSRWSLKPARRVAGQWIDYRFLGRLDTRILQPHRRARNGAAGIDYEVSLERFGMTAPTRWNQHSCAARTVLIDTETDDRRPLKQFDVGDLAEKLPRT